jgi:hypothetical protein
MLNKNRNSDKPPFCFLGQQFPMMTIDFFDFFDEKLELASFRLKTIQRSDRDRHGTISFLPLAKSFLGTKVVTFQELKLLLGCNLKRSLLKVLLTFKIQKVSFWILILFSL